ncbi:MAG: hypothetical protein K8H84_02915 [Sulfuricella denitrificans]|nr:hypothetical protein [Sulfuricella denitrificans]
MRPLAEGDQYFYDRSKLYFSGDEITYWKKVAFKIPVTLKGQAAVSGLYRERIHCAEHTLKLISHLLYAADGSTIEYIANHEGEAAPIIPDTVGDIFEKTVCDLVRQKMEQARQKNRADEKKPEHIQTDPVPATQASDSETKEPVEKTPSMGPDEEQKPPVSPSPPVVN